jgi:large subunit ribosomal protein L24
MQKIKRGDKVVVLAGKDKGKQGSILKILYTDTQPKRVFKAIVEGINLVKKHKKADPSKNSPGSIVSKEMPIAISNIALLNPKTNKADKVGFKFLNKDNGQKKVRYYKSSQEVIDVQ